jgi:hypothetical protein
MEGPAVRARRTLDMHSRGLPEAAAAARRLELLPEGAAGTETVRKSESSRADDTRPSVPPPLGALPSRPIWV